MEQIERARDLACRLLADSIPQRWSHSQGVAHKAESIAHLVGQDAPALVSAAWLHDIGYAPDLSVTGMHQLDGARYLRDVVQADALVCRLVAHHSCAFIEARNRGLSEQLASEFPAVEGLISAAITYADMTTTPVGEPTDVEQRLTEILARYGDGDLVAESIREASPLIVDSVRIITDALTDC